MAFGAQPRSARSGTSSSSIPGRPGATARTSGSEWRALGYPAEPDFDRACDEYDRSSRSCGDSSPMSDSCRPTPGRASTRSTSATRPVSRRGASSSAGWARSSGGASRGRSGILRPGRLAGHRGDPRTGDPRGRRRRLARREDRRRRPRLPDQRRGHPPVPRARRRGRLRGHRGPPPPLGRPGRRLPPDVHAQPRGRRRSSLSIPGSSPCPSGRSLLERGFTLLEVPEAEFATMGGERPGPRAGQVPGPGRQSPDRRGPREGRDRGPDLRGRGDLGQGRRRPDLPDPPPPLAGMGEGVPRARKLTISAGNPILRG